MLNFHNFVCAIISSTNKLHAPDYNGANLLYNVIGENAVVMEKKQDKFMILHFIIFTFNAYFTYFMCMTRNSLRCNAFKI